MQLPEENVVDLEFETERGELQRMLKQVSPWGRWIGVVFALLMVFSPIATALLQGRTLTLTDALVPLFIGAGIVAVTLWLRRRPFRSERVHYRFTPDRVVIEDATGRFEGKWDAIAARAIEVPLGFMLYAPNHIVRILPRRAFADEEAVARFRVLASAPLSVKPKHSQRPGSVLALWVVLILMMLVVYQVLSVTQPPRPEGTGDSESSESQSDE